MNVTTTEALERLAHRYGLPPGSVSRLELLLDLVAQERSSITSVRDQRAAVDVHVADSLAALSLAVVRSATRIADVGAGAGFPGWCWPSRCLERGSRSSRA